MRREEDTEKFNYHKSNLQCYRAPQMGQCFQTGNVSPNIFCCSRESLFNSTGLYSSVAVIFGGLPGTTTLLIRFSNLCLHIN